MLSTPLLISRRRMEALRLRSLRSATLIAAALNLCLAALGFVLLSVALRRCGGREKVPVASAASLGVVRLGAMVGSGMAQGATALAIAPGLVNGGGSNEDDDDDFRMVRRDRMLAKEAGGKA